MYDDEAKMAEMPQGLTMAGAREPDMTLNLHPHFDLRIVTRMSTINMEIRSGKLGKVTQTEVIRK